jgi:hypothetical protein
VAPLIADREIVDELGLHRSDEAGSHVRERREQINPLARTSRFLSACCKRFAFCPETGGHLVPRKGSVNGMPVKKSLGRPASAKAVHARAILLGATPSNRTILMGVVTLITIFRPSNTVVDR